MPAPVPLDRGWTFQAAGGRPQPVTVPHVMQANPTPASFPGTTGTYRLRFTPPRLPDGFAWALRFEEVRRVARITLNGVLLGIHTDPYVPFTLPAGPLRPGRPNELVVDVDNRKGPEPREGWWNWGGITRPVTLVPQGPVVLNDPALLPRLACASSGRCRDGQFLLDGGMGEWGRRMQTPCAIAPFYGLLTWLNRDGRMFEDASQSSWFMFGAGGNTVWIDPDHEAVVVSRWLDGAHSAGFVSRVARIFR